MIPRITTEAMPVPLGGRWTASVRSCMKFSMNSLQQLSSFGQSVWLDFIERGLIASGELTRLIEQDGLRGVTSNPAIFEKTISGSPVYDEAIGKILLEKREPRGSSGSFKDPLTPKSVYERLAVADIQAAAMALEPVYHATEGRDGYVSLEVSPHLARDTELTIEEGRRLWKAVGKPNLMIKVPATSEGVPAIRHLISEGINVNVTLLFSTEMYVKVAEAYMSGLESLAKRGGRISRVASVASFFISRIDTLVDARLNAVSAQAASGIQGRVAIANAKLTYQVYKRLLDLPRWKALVAKGAQPQRLLWASTSTKNPNYRDVLYVEELIGKDTVNTLPPATLEAFRDHGIARPSLEEDLDSARAVLDQLRGVGISLSEVTDQLLTDAVRLFVEPFDQLLGSIEKKLKVG